jgi:putative sterol carrier protein
MKMREEWVKEMIAQHKAKKKGQLTEARKESAGAGPKTAKSCKELLQMMPLGFNPTAAAGLTAVYQFEVSGDENFVAHLQIAEGACIFREGPAVHPSVVIKTPADVWLAVAKGEMDGQ